MRSDLPWWPLLARLSAHAAEMPSTAFEWPRLEVRLLRHSAALDGEMAKTKELKAWEREFRRKVLMEDGLVDRLEAAEMTGVTDRTLLRWHREGKGPPRIYRGRSVYYRIAEIEAWLGQSDQHSAVSLDPCPGTV